MKDFKFTHLGENLLLHPYKGLYWEKYNMLICADLHLGKATHFRKSGVPIPEAIHQPDLDRLAHLIEIYTPRRVLFLGDLFHSSYNNAWNTFSSFCEQRSELSFELIMGNHDILDINQYNFLLVHEAHLEIGPYILSHIPLNIEHIHNKYNLCGHLHPSIRISGSAKQSLRVECFYFGEKHGILPAFGNFTGNAKMPNRKKEDTVFAIANQKIIQLF